DRPLAGGDSMTNTRSIAIAIVVALAACKSGRREKSHGENGDERGEHEHEHDDKGEKGHGEGAAVHLTPEQIKAANIQLAKVEVRKETAVLEANGQIVAADDRQARVGVRVPGRVHALQAAVGDTVKKGQVLAIVESPELGRA